LIRSVDPIEVPPYLWTIKAIECMKKRGQKKVSTALNQRATLHVATQNNKAPPPNF
jgi:hypothetical protein